MNEAFNKILDGLERESAGKPTPDEYNNGIDRAYQIVQGVAEEFATDTNVWNNGWIPCSVRLPEECTEVLVSVKEIDGSFYTRTSWVQDGVWVIKKTPLQPTVIAWQSLPEPFKESD